jgi:hypothetical protein
VEHWLRERQFTVLLRFLHLHGGLVYEEKLPRCLDTFRDMRREGLVGFEHSDGSAADRVNHSQVRMSSKGHEWLRERDCLTFGREHRHGLRQWDNDFSRLLLKGELPTQENADAE